MYDATVGRWLSEDPIGFTGEDANLYRYVGNRVTFAVDHYGLRDTKTTEQVADKIQRMRGGIHVLVTDEFAYTTDDDPNTLRVNDLSDLIDQLKGLKPKKIAVLELRGHGNPGSINFGRVRQNDQWQATSNDQANRMDVNNAKKLGELLRNSGCLAQSSIIVLDFCVTGNAKGANTAPQELAKGSGSVVYAPGGFVHPSKTFYEDRTMDILKEISDDDSRAELRGKSLWDLKKDDYRYTVYSGAPHPPHYRYNRARFESKYYHSEDNIWHIFEP